MIRSFLQRPLISFLVIFALINHSHCGIYFPPKLYKMFSANHEEHRHQKHPAEFSAEEQENCKKYVAYHVIDNMDLRNNMVIGIGSGTTVTYAVQRLAWRVKKENITNVVCIASSYQALLLLHEYNLDVGTMDKYTEIEWTVDGADEVDENGVLIKGGGGCLAQEKILAANSKSLYIMVDQTKKAKNLGMTWKNGIPIEVLPMAHKTVQKTVNRLFGGEVTLRLAKMKMGPVVTDNGNFLLDWRFPSDLSNWRLIEASIKYIPGVVEVGLFVNLTTAIYVGKGVDSIEEIIPTKSSEDSIEFASLLNRLARQNVKVNSVSASGNITAESTSNVTSNSN